MNGSYVNVLRILVLAVLSFSLPLSAQENACNSRSYSEAEDTVMQAYIAYYGRPADPAGLEFWAGLLESQGGSLNSIIAAFGASEEFDSRFGDLSNTELVSNIFQQLFGREPDPAGLDFYSNVLSSGERTLQSIALDVLFGAQNNDLGIVDNRLDLSRYYVDGVDQNSLRLLGASQLAAFNASVSDDSDTLQKACVAMLSPDLGNLEFISITAGGKNTSIVADKSGKTRVSVTTLNEGVDSPSVEVVESSASSFTAAILVDEDGRPTRVDLDSGYVLFSEFTEESVLLTFFTDTDQEIVALELHLDTSDILTLVDRFEAIVAGTAARLRRNVGDDSAVESSLGRAISFGSALSNITGCVVNAALGERELLGGLIGGQEEFRDEIQVWSQESCLSPIAATASLLSQTARENLNVREIQAEACDSGSCYVAIAEPTSSVVAEAGDEVVFYGFGKESGVVLWEFGDGSSSSLDWVDHVYLEPGDYTATLTVTYGGDRQISDSVSVSITAEEVNTAIISDSSLMSCISSLDIRYTFELTELDCSDRGITSLSGIEQFTKLSVVRLDDNNIADFSPLQDLAQLRGLYIERNELASLSTLINIEGLAVLHVGFNAISDLAPIIGMKNLFVLDMPGNNIVDLAPIAELTNMAFITADDNSISDLSPLVGLRNIKQIYMSNNLIKDLTPLSRLTKLSDVSLSRNAITTLSPLSKLNRILYLDLRLNEFTDLAALSGMSTLLSLNLQGNPIVDIAPLANLLTMTQLYVGRTSLSEGVADISALAKLVNLTTLVLSENSISDLSPLTALTNLVELDLWDNQVSDLSPVAGLRELESLNVAGNNVSNLSALSALDSLEVLVIYQNSIGDLSPLSELDQLTAISAQNNVIFDLSPLDNLPALVSLNFGDNIVSDLSPLASANQLVKLILWNNAIDNIEALAGLTSLQELDLSGNSITDLVPLEGLDDLSDLNLSGNPLPDILALSGLDKIEELSIAYIDTITDISPLLSLDSLTFIDLSGLENVTCSSIETLKEQLSGASISEPETCVQ